MTGTELSARLTALGLTADMLADTMNRHPAEIRTWMRINGSLPRSIVQRIEWVLALHERELAMAASGLPECAWVEARSKVMELVGHDQRAVTKYIADLTQHATTCDICQRREAYGAQLPELPQPPLPTYIRVLGKTAELINKLPIWLRPAAAGALVVGTVTLARTILSVTIGQTHVNTQLLLVLLGAIAFGAYGGLIGGFVYRLVLARTRHLGRAGDYLTGILSANAVVVAVAAPLAPFTNDGTFRSVTDWIIFLLMGTLFGLIIGQTLSRRRSSALPNQHTK